MERLKILDGFRVLAILIVMLFHFYTLFQGEKYLYNFNFTNIFSFGRLGVEFFFIISGFVITLTLKNCTSFFEFLKKRLLRLLPAMLICSFITFSVFNIFDTSIIFPKSHSVANLLVSNTFISPTLFNSLFQSDFDYIDGAYWSLWVEINFYIVIGLLYFFNKVNLLRNFSIVCIFFTLTYFFFTSNILGNLIRPYIGADQLALGQKFFIVFNIVSYCNWFLLGIILNYLHQGKSLKYFIFFTLVFLFQLLIMNYNLQSTLFMVCVYFLFILFINQTRLLSLEQNL